MSIQAVLDETAFNSLPDSTVIGKDSFVKNEKDNVFYLNIPGEEAAKLATPLQKEVERLRKHSETVLGEKKTLGDKIKAWEALGKTPEEIADLLKNKPEDVAVLESRYKAQLDSVQSSSKAEIDRLAAERESAYEQVRKTLKASAISDAMREFQTSKLAADVLDRRVTVIPESEGSTNYVVRVLDDNGEIAYVAGAPKTIGQFLSEKRNDKEYQGMFYAGQGQGSGAGNRTTGVSNGTVSANDINAIQNNLEAIAAGKIKIV